MERWRRVGRCERCGHADEVIVFKPADFAPRPSGTWVCGNCDPAEHADYATGLALLTDGEERN